MHCFMFQLWRPQVCCSFQRQFWDESCQSNQESNILKHNKNPQPCFHSSNLVFSLENHQGRHTWGVQFHTQSRSFQSKKKNIHIYLYRYIYLNQYLKTKWIYKTSRVLHELLIRGGWWHTLLFKTVHLSALALTPSFEKERNSCKHRSSSCRFSEADHWIEHWL